MKNMSDCVYPCPCGWYGDSLKPCTCAPAMVTKYQKRISGPLLDRIDTACRIEVLRVDYEKLSGYKPSESSESIRARVQAARNIQQTRFTNPNSRTSNIISNADMRIGEIRQFCQLQAEGGALSVSKCQSLMRAATSCCTHGAARFTSIFWASSFFCSQAESTPAHTQLTQAVRLNGGR